MKCLLIGMSIAQDWADGSVSGLRVHSIGRNTDHVRASQDISVTVRSYEGQKRGVGALAKNMISS